MTHALEARLGAILRADPRRLACLEIAREACLAEGISDYLLAAGFVRNAVWDHLHDAAHSPLNDVDLIFMGLSQRESSALNTERPDDGNSQTAKHQEQRLLLALKSAALTRSRASAAEIPDNLTVDIPWEVKNQRRMHLKHGDAPYGSLIAAMAAWPEQETAVGVRLNPDGELEFQSSWGLESLFALKLTPAPGRSLAVFHQRLAQKDWLRRFPRLTVDVAKG